MCRHFCKPYTCINSFNSHNIPIKYALFCPLYGRGNRHKSHSCLVPGEDSNNGNMTSAFLLLTIILSF